MHSLDDVAALTEGPQRGFGLLVDLPLAGTDLVSEPEGFELAQPADLHRQECIRSAIGIAGHVDDACLALIPEQLAIELGPALRLHLPLDGMVDVEVSA